jgi:outer membrane protein assembly factor BamB
MLKRVLSAVVVLIAVVAAVAAVLYLFFGLRVGLDGGGTPHLTFVVDSETQADLVARHREAQRRELAQGIAQAEPVEPHVAAVPSSQSADADRVTSGDQATGGSERTRPAAKPYWTDFRGPFRDGHYREQPIRTNWPAGGLKPLWKQPVGGGYASFVIAGNHAFTIEQRGPQEVVSGYDVRTGRELWTNGWNALFTESLGGDGPRATPTWADGIVYALGATGELRALNDGTGRVLWRTNIIDDNGATNLDWGMAASPLVVGDTVVVLPGGPNGRSVVAYHRRTGKRAWSALGDKQAYSSPMLVTLGGVRQIVVFSATRLMGLSPDRGELLWDYAWQTPFDINAGQPLLVGDNRIFLSSGYGTGAAVIELTPSGSRFSVREVWRNNRMKNQFTSSVLHEGFVYGLDEAILACLDVATGQLRWKGGRYGYGQVLLANGHLIVLAENGDLALVRATPERHEELARFPVLNGKTWNHPAMADGHLLIRNLAEMAAFDLR